MRIKVQLCILIGMLLIGLMAAASVAGQDATQEAEKNCSPEQWAGFAAPLLDAVNTLAKAEDPLAALLQIDAQIQTIRASCAGGVWTSDEYGAGSTVIGPITFDGTLYKATLTSEKNASVRVTALEGDCGFSAVGAVSSDEATESSVLWKFKECEAYFEVNGFGTPWTLSVVKVK